MELRAAAAPTATGFYLKVATELRTFVKGKRCDIGLGGLKVVMLAEAREEARRCRAIARDDGDPFAEKRRARRVVPTSRQDRAQGAGQGLEERQEWRTVDQHARGLRLSSLWRPAGRQIDTPEILKALSPIWLTKQETALQVR
jgi:hypothetical protein